MTSLRRNSSIPSYIVSRENTVEIDEADLRWRRSSHAAISAMLPSHTAFHSDTGLTLTRQITDPLRRRSVAQRRKSVAAITREAVSGRGLDLKSRGSTIRQLLMGMSTIDAWMLGQEDRLQTVESIRSMTATLSVKKRYRDQVLTQEASTLRGWTLRKYQLSMQKTFENIVAKKEMAPAGAISFFATMFSKLSNMEFTFLSVVWTFVQIFLTAVCCKMLYVQWHRFIDWARSWIYELELWAGAFKVIEGRFGTSTVSYFRFLRWLMFLNLFMSLFMFGIVLVPFLLLEPVGEGSFTSSVNACASIYHNEAVFHSSNYTSLVKRKAEESSTADKIQDVLQGTGWMENTVLFYGVFYSKTGYDMPLAYLCAVGASFLLCFILLVKNSAKGFKQSAVASVGGNITLYCNKVFGAWDYCISEQETAGLKHSNILQDIKNELEYQRLQWKKASRTTKEKFKLYSIRFLINILVILILGGALYLIYFTNQKLVELERTSSLNEAEALLMQFLPSVTIMLLNVIVPTLFNKVVIAEDYMPTFAIRITLIRTVLLRLASLGILMISLYTTLQPKKKNLGVLIPCDNLISPYSSANTTTALPVQTTNTITVQNDTATDENDNDQGDNIMCWETYFGQQIYKLVMLNFLVVIVATFGWEFPRKFIHSKFHMKLKVVDFVGQQTFDLSKSVLDLVYLQTLCWLGVFFSPIIPAMCFAKCFIFFYVKKFQPMTLLAYILLHQSLLSKGSLITNCLPMQQYGTTKSNSLFMMVLLLSFFLASIPIIYMIGSIPPSQGCGPFRVYTSSSFIMFDAITNLVQGSSQAQEVFSVVATPAFMAVLAFCLCLLMYYFWMVGQANYKLSKSLREQLKIEGQDKQFLVARVNEAYARDTE